MVLKTTRRALALFLMFGLVFMNAVPVFALGELPVDLCPNIADAQTSIPGGMILDGSGNCVLADATPPVISGVVNQSLLSTAATIVWVTDELSVSTFEYGTTQTYGSSASVSASLLIGGTAVLTGLTPSTAYYYCIHATDASTNASQSCSSFTTAAAADTTGPVISGLIKTPLVSQATIAWTTDELATSQIRWGATQSYGSTLAVNTTAGLAHTGTLLNLAANTTYYYCIDATDAASNLTSLCDSITTDAAPTVQESDPPILSLVVVASTDTTSATITWTTDEIADTQVQYGTTAGYGSATTLDSSLSLAHTATISGLSAGTLYHYRVVSADHEGNTTNGPDNTFTTDAISVSGGGGGGGGVGASIMLSSVGATSISTTSATVTWDSSVAGDSQVEYGINSNFGSVTTLNTSLATSHSVTISGLEANTNYIFRAKSKPAGASVATVSQNYEFSTLEASAPVSVPAVISSVAASPSATAATVTWTTDKAATGFLEYGITTTYGLDGTLDSSFQTSHTESLANLQSSTMYHYRLISVDGDGNTTTSADRTFTTAAPVSGVVAAPAAVAVSVSDHGDTYATLSWNVASALVDTAAEYDIHYSTQPITDQSFESSHAAQEVIIGYEDLQPSGTSRTYTVVGLSPSTRYYFAVKSKFQASDWSAISNDPSVTTLAASVSGSSGGASLDTDTSADGPSAASGGAGGALASASASVAGPVQVTASGNQLQISLNWQNPTNSNYVRTIIVEKHGGYPQSRTDGTIIYEGRGESFTDADPEDGTPGYYALYSFDKEGNYSAPVRVSLTSGAGATQSSVAKKSYASQTTRYSFIDALEPGDTGLEVRHLQQILKEHPDLYPKKLVTGYFGSYTRAAIQKFQKQQGLAQTGVADEKTAALLNNRALDAPVVVLNTLNSSFDKDIQYGQMSDDVEALQRFLIQQGFYKEAIISEYFGSLTRTAVILFQEKYGITPAQGYVGVKTRAQIKTILGQ